MESKREDYAYILDYLAHGAPDTKRFKREPVAYALGEREFKLLLLIPKPGAEIAIGERVYIGKDLARRTKILHVKRRIGYEDLTNTAQMEIPYVIEKIVMENEKRFVDFYNKAGPISTRYHMLELLPGLGKKSMWAILEERKKEPFKSFKDIAERVSTVHKPEKLIINRIEKELSDPTQKYHLFVAR